MTSRQLSIIAKKVLHILPEFAVKGPLIFKITSEEIFLGLHFGGSSRDGRIFRMNAFFLPLFVLTDTIHFNYGIRISSGSGQWNADNPNLIGELVGSIGSQARPFLDSVSTLDGALKYLRAQVEANAGHVNPHTLEALTCTLIKAGHFPAALKTVAEQKRLLENATVPWMDELRKRAVLIEEKILQGSEVALQQLDAWRAETIHKLSMN